MCFIPITGNLSAKMRVIYAGSLLGLTGLSSLKTMVNIGKNTDNSYAIPIRKTIEKNKVK